MYVTFKCLKCESVTLVHVQTDGGAVAPVRCGECGCEGKMKTICPKCNSIRVLVSVANRFRECAECQYKGAAEAFLFVLG